MPDVEIEAGFPKKLQFLFERCRYKVAYGGRGCLARGSKVIMSDGSLKKIEDVVIGDFLLGPDSKPRKVLDLFRGKEMMYRVKQTSAQDYIVNGAHVLVLKKSKSCLLDKGELFESGNYRRPRGRYPDYPDEIEISVEDWIKKSNRWKENFRGFRAGLIQFDNKDVTIDPYLLGLWLGDGLHRELMITSADQEIIDWLAGHAKENGLNCTISKKYGKSNKAVDIRLARIPEIHGRENPVWREFKKYNVASNKHIPEDFIINDENIRLRLLAGLIDSDGTYAKGGYVITLANEILARDVKRLADTLGFRTSIKEKETRCGDFRGKSWRIGINGDTQRVPCLIERKKAISSPNKDKMLSMISIDPIGIDDYFGVLLDGDHRFLLEDGTVTHNSAKSWSFARALLIIGVDEQLRILCAREIQKSIKQSVHKLLSDQIIELGLENEYEVFETEIRGRNGTYISFSGLSDHTVATIKSFEGCDIVWVEEAQTVSKRSWDILVPTIRKDNSEIWVTFNPELDTDETYMRFVVNPPDDCISVEINYSDNPWFPEVLEKERERCKIVDPEDYPTIWEGKCRSSVIGAIYAKEVDAAIRDGRVCNVPYNPLLKVHAIWDLGWNDSMFIILAQRVRNEIGIIEVIEEDHKTLDWYVGELQNKRYNWGYDFLPHDGEHGDFKTGLSAKKILEKFGRKVKITQNIPIEDGIKIARMSFRQMVFDKNKSARLIECLKRYKRSINRATQEPGSPVHDQYSHGADCFRYLSLVADELTNETERRNINTNFATFGTTVSGMGG